MFMESDTEVPNEVYYVLRNLGCINFAAVIIALLSFVVLLGVKKFNGLKASLPFTPDRPPRRRPERPAALYPAALRAHPTSAFP